MKEEIDNYDFYPVEMTTSEGFYKNMPTTFYSIELEADFDEDIAKLLTDLGLDNTGYVLEGIIDAFLKAEKPELRKAITGNDCELSTFVIYADTKNNQHLLAKEIQRLCTNIDLFEKIVKANLKSLKEIDENDDDDDF